MLAERQTTSWMRSLAHHYQRTRAAYPDDELIALFDVDGTIVDLRPMMLRLLHRYDHERGARYFRGLGLEDFDVTENQIESLLDGMPHLPDDVRADAARWYRRRYWNRDVMLESHRPFSGVMEVMRWFQIQPGTSVGINTARTERMRDDTLASLNGLGREFKVEFKSELVFMSPYGWNSDIESAKCEGIRYFQRMGYRVVAFVDNEPANLEAVAEMEGSEGILLLHADTLFESARSRLPASTVGGDTYDITELASPDAQLRPVGPAQFVWHGVDDRDGLRRFVESDVQWCEMAVRTDPATRALILNREETDERHPADLLVLDEALNVALGAGKSVKFDLKEDGRTLDALVRVISARRTEFGDLWFNASVHTLGEEGFRRLRREYPDAVIQCPVDFMTPLIVAMPDEAERLLATIAGWGVNRMSISWKTPLRRQILDALEGWGYEINIYNVPDLESFLKAALLLPTSLTMDFSKPSP